MTFLVERLSELRRHLDHLREIRPRVGGREDLERDLSSTPPFGSSRPRTPELPPGRQNRNVCWTLAEPRSKYPR